ncbi:MAG: hypothetical protein AB7L92_04875, partial [Alphaproteobacteria bacterium]
CYIEWTFWSVIPALVTLFFILLQVSPKYVPGLSYVMPLMHMGVIYYWGVHRSREMPYWFLGLAGIINDLLQGLPPGITALLYVMFLIIVQSQIRHIYKENFLMKWGFFTGLMFVMQGVQWLLMAVITGQNYPLVMPLIQWITTAGCYPLVHLLCNKINQRAMERRWHLQHVK